MARPDIGTSYARLSLVLARPTRADNRPAGGQAGDGHVHLTLARLTRFLTLARFPILARLTRTDRMECNLSFLFDIRLLIRWWRGG